MSFDRLIRFVDENGRTEFGNLKEETPLHEIAGAKVQLVQGSLDQGFHVTDETRTVKKLLCPLPSTPIILCVGLNYRQHANEAKLTVPRYPVIFTKPADALTGPIDDVEVHPDAQEMMDYEGELTVVIGKDAKNVTEDEALDYVLGYTSGNDVSARNFQLPDVSGGQFCYAKSFDGFAPIGPCITSPKLIPDPQTISFVTKVNGDVRQKTSTSDMIWSVKQLIAHLSRGTTLRKGSLIMTGTPSGVGIFMSPKGFVKNGDIVEVYFEKIGSIANKMHFLNV